MGFSCNKTLFKLDKFSNVSICMIVNSFRDKFTRSNLINGLNRCLLMLTSLFCDKSNSSSSHCLPNSDTSLNSISLFERKFSLLNFFNETNSLSLFSATKSLSCKSSSTRLIKSLKRVESKWDILFELKFSTIKLDKRPKRDECMRVILFNSKWSRSSERRLPKVNGSSKFEIALLAKFKFIKFTSSPEMALNVRASICWMFCEDKSSSSCFVNFPCTFELEL